MAIRTPRSMTRASGKTHAGRAATRPARKARAAGKPAGGPDRAQVAQRAQFETDYPRDRERPELYPYTISGVPIAPLYGPETLAGMDMARDLAVADNAANTVSVLPGNGDGTFAPRTDFGTGNTPWFVAIADLNRDGKPDLATANGTASTVSVLLNARIGNPWLGVEPAGALRTALLLAPAPNPTRAAMTLAFELPASELWRAMPKSISLTWAGS